MYVTITFQDFVDRFNKMRPNNFSYEGLSRLWDYFEELEQDTGKDIELDVVAICCDFTEYESLKEFNKDMTANYEDIEEIEDKTLVIRIDDDRFIVQAY